MKITLAYILSLVAGFFMVTIHAQELNDQEVEAAFQQQLLFSDSVRQKNPESSYHHLQQAYDFAHTYDHDSLKVWSYIKLGEYHQRYTGYDSAIRYFERAVKLSEQLEDTYLRVESNRTLAMQEVDRGEIDKAMQRLQVALDLAIELPEKSKLDLQISMSMAYVLMDGGFYDKALDYLFEAQERNPYSEEEMITRLIYHAIGFAYMDSSRPDTAIHYFGLVVKDLPYEGHENRYSAYYNNLGICYQNKGDFELAEEYYLKSLKIDMEAGVTNWIASSYTNLSTNYLLMEDAEKALDYALKGLEIAKQLGDPQLLRQFLSLTKESYEMLGDYKRAFEYQEQEIPLLDSLLDKERFNQLAELEATYQTEKKEQQIALQNEQISRQNVFRNALIGGVVLVLVIAGLIYRNTRIKTRSLQQKESLLKEIHHRVKNNLQVISSILNMQSRGTEDEGMLEAIKEGQSRVKAMSLIHQKLYQTDDLSEINIQEYITDLNNQIAALYQNEDRKVENRINASDLKLDIDTAIPLGLILNELISNAYKYAFEGIEKGLLQIELKRIDKEKLQLEVADNGKGLPANFDLDKAKSLGLKLVNILTKQLKGSVSCSVDQGTRFLITFSDLNIAK